MTTAADVKRVTRLVREREPRLILVKRTLILPSAGHYLRAFNLAGLSDKDRFRIHYLVRPLYRPISGDAVGIGFGDVLHDNYGPWSTSDSRIEERIADALLGDGMARIEHVDDPDAFLEYAKTLDDLMTGGDWHIFLTHLLLGHRDRATDLGMQTLRRYYSHTPQSRHTRRFLLLMDDGQARVDRVLKSWEQTAVRRLKIEPYWKSPWRS
jgi:hypothetical protein